MTSLAKQIRQLQLEVDALKDGAYATASPLGPGRISGANIKAKSIVGNMLNVTDLESITSQTGNLTVSGSIMAGSGASRIGWTPSDGIYLGSENPALAPFKVTPAGAMAATGANVSGTITTAALSATGGSIGTFGITALDGLSHGSGGQTRGISVGSTTFYAGSATPGTAPFRVDRFGNTVMTNATISGSSTFSGSLSGAAGTFSGSLSGATGSFAGSLSAATGSLGTLSVSGTVTMSGGQITLPGGGSITSGALDINSATFSGITVDGTITLGAGGKITDADGSYWDQSGIVLVSSGSFGDSIKWKVGGVDKGSIWVNSTTMFVGLNGSGATLGQVAFSSGHASLDGGTAGLFVDNGWGAFSQGKFYPGGSSDTSQSSYYIDAAGIIGNGIGIGGMLGISAGNTINFVAPSNGGSASNWSSFTTANVPDKAAGYLVFQIGGQNFRMAFYADS